MSQDPHRKGIPVMKQDSTLTAQLPAAPGVEATTLSISSGGADMHTTSFNDMMITSNPRAWPAGIYQALAHWNADYFREGQVSFDRSGSQSGDKSTISIPSARVAAALEDVAQRIVQDGVVTPEEQKQYAILLSHVKKIMLETTKTDRVDMTDSNQMFGIIKHDAGFSAKDEESIAREAARIAPADGLAATKPAQGKSVRG